MTLRCFGSVFLADKLYIESYILVLYAKSLMQFGCLVSLAQPRAPVWGWGLKNSHSGPLGHDFFFFFQYFHNFQEI